LAAAAASGFPPARAESGWASSNMPRGVTEISRKIYDLHMEIFWVCVAIAVVVFGAMLWSIITYRKSRGAIPDGTLVHNTKVEFMWTVVPVIILIAMALPAARTLVEIEDTTRPSSPSGHRLPVGVAIRLPRRRRAYYSRLDRKSDAARELLSGIDPNTVDHICSTSITRWWCRSAPRCACWSPPRTSSIPGGAGLRREERRDPGLRERGVVQSGHGQAGTLPRSVRGAVRP